MTFGNFKGKSSEEFIGWMNRSRYHDMLSGFTFEDMLKVEELGDNHEVPMSTRWLNDNEGW